ncbi:peptidoglycan D,D-transpeptidase FtsI family protein [Actinomyces sp. W5033]|uniref:peptidoglycan D,D-transpeptidase FtsI family protein n=1 Tax=Actinomyces sp. W5033 TaxID=3446479 RepID=UPI003EE1B867
MYPSRRRVLQAAGVAAFATVTGRTAWLQLVKGRDLAEQALAERTETWVNRALRGRILAADGTVLAASSVSYDIGVNQGLISQYEHYVFHDDPETGERTAELVGHGAAEVAAQIAPLLGVDAQELGALMVGNSTYVVIADAVNPEIWRQIKALDIHGIEPDQHPHRSYPAGKVAGNIVGFSYEDPPRVLVGANGLEYSQNEVLTGIDGRGSVERTPGDVNIPTGHHEEVEAVAGTDVRTTLDADLQTVAQQAIDEVVTAQGAEWGCVVVMEPSTGKVLVMADSNAMDPSDPLASAPQDRGSRCVEAVFEPGSVGKVMTFAAALEEGVVTAGDTFTVPDTWTAANGQVFEDSHEHEVQRLTAAQVLAESSNVGTVQIGERVSDERRHHYIEAFGYNQLSGIELPGESSGLLSDWTEWDDRTRYTTMFGQGVAGTALQSAQVLATVANKGVRVAPRVIDAFIAPDGTETLQPRAQGVRVISEQTAAALTEMLIGVTQEGGTAEAASLDGYLVAGKTGTTEILTGSGTVASFVGFVPARDPAIAVAVVVNRPSGTYGGTVAAPVFRKIALAAMHSLGIAPDPLVIAAQAAAEADAQATAQATAQADAG